MRLRSTSRIQRLARREDRATIKRIFYFSIISVALTVFVFTLGIGTLGKFADLLGGIFQKKVDSQENIAGPAPPRLDELPQATNSATLTVSGFADESSTVVIFLDSEEMDQIEVKNGKFSFENLSLKDGENKISAKAKIGSQESDFSQTRTVVLDKEEPKLTVETPADGQTFGGNNRISVKGEADKDAQVYANGFLASLSSEGKFEVLVPVPEGESTIEVKAIDEAQNTKIETRKVIYRK